MKSTKKALFTSVLALVLCMSMLVGSTFAWFTDEAKTNVNTITAGNLDIQLLDAEGNSLENQTLELAGTNVSQYIEPNGTYEFEPVTIKNAGNVNLKYKVTITGISGDTGLLKVLTWEFIVDGQTDTNFDSYEGTLEPNGTHTLKIRFTMDKDAGNEYKNLTLSGVAINVTAAQATGDNDSFQDDYDKLAEYPTVSEPDVPETTGPVVEDVGTLAELKEAFAKAAEQSTGDMVINLTKSFDVAGAWEAFTPKGYNGVNNVTINGNGFAIKNLNEPLMIGSFAGAGSITINDLTIENATISAGRYNNLGLGAFLAYSDASGGVVLNNCKLVNSTVECTDGYAGGLIGYTSTPATITGCSVTGCSITGGNSSGAIAGQFAASATVSNCTVTGTTVDYANGDDVDTDSWRVGVVVGTANVGTVTMTNITESGNTLKQGAVVAPEHSNLYGRSLGNGITLDGKAI